MDDAHAVGVRQRFAKLDPDAAGDLRGELPEPFQKLAK